MPNRSLKSLQTASFMLQTSDIIDNMPSFLSKIIGSELSRGLTASVLIHAAALVGVGGLLISPPRPLGAATQAIEIEYTQEPTVQETKGTESSVPPLTTLQGEIKTSAESTKSISRAHSLKAVLKPRATEPTVKKVTQPAPPKPQSTESSVGPFGPVNSFEDLVPAATTWSPKPPYPFAARQAKFEGKVLLAVNIDQMGSPMAGKIVNSSGRADCDKVALDTVLSRWRFEPAKILGRPVSWEQKIEVEYRLR